MGEDKIDAPGRKANAAQPPKAAERNAEPKRYPSVRPDDAVEAPAERRSFKGGGAPKPCGGADDASIPTSVNEGRLGPGADPAEGKR